MRREEIITGPHARGGHTRRPNCDGRVHRLFNRRSSACAGASTLLAALARRAVAQSATPLDTVKVITGFTPGGTSDTICRRVAAKLQPGYGRSVVVENRSGAGGQLVFLGEAPNA